MLDQMRSLAQTLENLQITVSDTNSNQQLLEKLHFTSISTRERKIEEAHEDTFQWLTNPDAQASYLSLCLHFITWLRDGDGVFWIYGKPGSGKSTFMKYVFTQKSVTEHLDHWAEGCKLVKASFYFWYAGHPLQRSLEGLLRTLLFEILCHTPDVIPSIIDNPKLAVPLSYEEDWDLETLFEIYEAVLHQKNDIRYCFFIDGLDEFKDEEHRNIRDLISTLHRLETSDKIKLCMASRPWQEFEDVYGQTPSKRLKLEDLTRDDIHAYVSDNFNSHEKFLELRNRDPNYDGLIDEVVNRAQGVFLWVRLVVQQLLDGFTFHKSVQTLQRQLAGFPEDLDIFFDHMLNSISATDRNQAAQILQIAAEADEPRLLIFYHFLNEIILGEADELDPSYTPLDVDDVSARCENMRRQLNGITRGLLEVTMDSSLQYAPATDPDSPYFRFKVDFLHRTVRDFLVKSLKTLDFFRGNMDSIVSLSIASATAAVAQLKYAQFPAGKHDITNQVLSELFFYTRHAARHAVSHPEVVTALDGLLVTAERVCQEISRNTDYILSFPGMAAQSGHTSFLERKFQAGLSLGEMESRKDGERPNHVHWDNHDWFSSRELRLLMKPHHLTLFLANLLRLGKEKPKRLSEPVPLLSYALCPTRNSAGPYIDTVQLLLSKGASYSQAYLSDHGIGNTVWRGFLRHMEGECRMIYSTGREFQHAKYFAVTKALLKQGAPLNCIMALNPEAGYIVSGRDIVEICFTPEQVKELIAATRPWKR